MGKGKMPRDKTYVEHVTEQIEYEKVIDEKHEANAKYLKSAAFKRLSPEERDIYIANWQAELITDLDDIQKGRAWVKKQRPRKRSSGSGQAKKE